MSDQKTLFDKLWDLHRIGDAGDGYDLIAIDRLMLHERTGGVALKSLSDKGYSIRDPSRVYAIMDHIVSFRPGRGRNESRTPGGDVFITETRRMAREAGIHLIDTDNPAQGIVHVVAPEQGIAVPGLTLLCPDSHTCSLGALGALAWGIGSSEAEHVMATGVLRAKKPKQMLVRIEGELQKGIVAKDIALHLIAEHGAAGGRRHAIEFAGSTIGQLAIEERLTLCNLAVEFAAHSALICPDQKVIDYVLGRPGAPHPNEDLLDHWASLKTDADADYDNIIEINASAIEAQISWGTSPEETIPIHGHVPFKARPAALTYMGLKSGQKIMGLPIDGAFIGSCTNGRLTDLEAAARVLEGRRVADGVRAVCVPGSKLVKRAAEEIGIDLIFKKAGFEWGEPGCAMCFYAGGETFLSESRVVSSTNRNFEGRQGPGVRTHLTSPAVVAASAVAGRICSPDALQDLDAKAVL
jgi:3-isopropylmalate/(R)-2-methylmalate dehydratase large subunit